MGAYDGVRRAAPPRGELGDLRDSPALRAVKERAATRTAERSRVREKGRLLGLDGGSFQIGGGFFAKINDGFFRIQIPANVRLIFMKTFEKKDDFEQVNTNIAEFRKNQLKLKKYDFCC